MLNTHFFSATKAFLSIAILCWGTSTFAQEIIHREMNASRVSTPPRIDGVLDEADWLTAMPATGFTEASPEPNTPSDFKTEVWILYDDNALYVGAKLHDPEPSQIKKQLGTRDDFGTVNADKFGVMIDGQYSRQNAFAFGVTAAGVEVDAFMTPNGGDNSWDAAWFSAVKITDDGWIAEMKIPYSQLRFSGKQEQVWGINFFREVRRIREESYWNPVNPAIGGEVQQYGDLKGLTNIQTPLRLSLLPYAVASLQHRNVSDPTANDFTPRFGGGMDLKYGINDAFTLDMALVPDFTDVLSDDQQLNLGPFELFFEERRPFFTEGVEIFGRAGIFYSRRVGGTPELYASVYDSLGANEQVASNPERTQLINATKISGRNKKGYGFGFFNAVTAPTFAKIEDENGNVREICTSPFTNYNVVVVDKLRRNNSFVSIINTNVTRFGKFDDANVTAVEFSESGKKNQYALSGKFAFSQVYLQSEEDPILGYSSFLSYGKTNGNWRWGVSQNVESDRYNPNDLGFLFSPNEINHQAYVSFRQFKPFGKFNNLTASVTLETSTLYRPFKYQNTILYTEVWSNTRKFMSSGLGFNWLPANSFDYFEPRKAGAKFLFPAKVEMFGWFSSDYRKTFALDGNFVMNTTYSGQFTRRVLGGELSPIWRVNDRLNLRASINLTLFNGDVGFTTFDNLGEPVLGSRNRQDLVNTLTANYIFNRTLSLNFRLRHYWALVEYKSFHSLQEDGSLGNSDYVGNRDLNFNAFNFDFFLRWRFAPGSEFNFTWKTAIYSPYNEPVEHNYLTNLGNLFVFDEDQTNTFTIKVLYYLDWNSLKKRKR